MRGGWRGGVLLSSTVDSLAMVEAPLVLRYFMTSWKAAPSFCTHKGDCEQTSCWCQHVVCPNVETLMQYSVRPPRVCVHVVCVCACRGMGGVDDKAQQ